MISDLQTSLRPLNHQINHPSMEFFSPLMMILFPTLLLSLLTAFFFFLDLGSLMELAKNIEGLRFVDWTMNRIFSSPIATTTIASGFVTSDPSNVEHFLKSSFDYYMKGEESHTIFFQLLGDGIFNTDGDSWKLQRRTVSHGFSAKNIRTFIFANVRFEILHRLLPFLSSAAARQSPFDLQDVLERFAFDTVCKLVSNNDPAQLGDDINDNSQARRFYKAFDKAACISFNRFNSLFPIIWKLKRALCLGSERGVNENIKIVDDYLMRVVKSRRQAALGDDLLSLFMAEKDQNYSDKFLRDTIASFVLAGRDTTSTALTWFFWLISMRPEVSRKIKNEIQRVRGSSNTDDILTLDQVRDMNYLHAALSETMRLYPPVPMQFRTSTKDDELPVGGVKVKKDQQMMCNTYAMGRSENLWGEDAGEFRPERWLDSNGIFQPVSMYKHPAFSAGPRMCPGKDVAYIQMKLVAATVIERYEVVVTDVEKVREPEVVILLKMKGGLKVRVRERDQPTRG